MLHDIFTNMQRRKNRSWLKFKQYTHFSKKFSKEDLSFIISYVSNEESIKSHKFYPLIHRSLLARKFKKKYDYAEKKEIRTHKFTNKEGKRESTTKIRKVYYPDHLDSMIYSYFANVVLGKKYEALLKADPELSNCIIAYRRIKKVTGRSNKNNIDFAYEIFGEIERQIAINKECVAIAFDITEFFDSLNHEILKKAWCDLINAEKLPDSHYNVFKSLTKFSYVHLDDILKEFKIPCYKELIKKNIQSFTSSYSDFRKRITKKGYIKKHPFYDKSIGRRKGIPQGTPISAFLANLYLLDFDREVLRKVKSLGGIYRRYSDDLVVICGRNYLDEIRQFITDLIANKYKLIIQNSKTQVSSFERDKEGEIQCVSQESSKPKPFQYLGFEFDGNVPLIKSASLAKFYRSMKRAIRVKANRAKIDFKKYDGKDKKNKGVIFKGVIYNRYSHLGHRGKKRNYYLYAKDASRIMQNKSVLKQLKNSWKILNRQLAKYRLRYELPDYEFTKHRPTTKTG